MPQHSAMNAKNANTPPHGFHGSMNTAGPIECTSTVATTAVSSPPSPPISRRTTTMRGDDERELHQGHAELHAERRAPRQEVDRQQREPHRRTGMRALAVRGERVADPPSGADERRMGEEAGDVELRLGHVARRVPRLPTDADQCDDQRDCE